MTGMLGRFVDLPPAARAAVIVAGGGSVVGAASLAIPSIPRYVPLILIGIALAGLVVLGFLALLKWRDKRKADSFDQSLKAGAGSAPVSSAGGRAKLDDLRRQFEKGVTTFREHGKDLYALPWYLLVGEPGSGKTEAIRHCNVGFPPGLHDPLQGTGGTVNMNWWFTNKAVILDTAGRLMFEEVEAGRSSEWKEFLRLLRTSRPVCPVNGLLLVIPADSLIKDTADEIQAKGGRIAEQLDGIQRTLGVRFPVFVVITKSDLIGGFREFFRDMEDPQLSQQMLGWSNPASLDDPFKPEEVEAHLRSVAERLRRRRMGLLMDPVHREDPAAGRRTDEVDALYGFPENLLKIAPRLRLYLEMVFVQGEWSTKPLFLRGMYFTSSMQEGAELDAELADALGVDLQSLPGEGWERNTSYFLRDLFLSKAFREKGLVTRATHARQHQRRARNIVYGVGIAAVVLLIAITALTARSLERTVGRQNQFWGDVAAYFAPDGGGDAPGTVVPILRPDDAAYYGHRQIPHAFDGEQLSVAGLPTKTFERASAPPPSTPWIYKPVAGITGSVFAKRAAAHASVLETVALGPAVGETRGRLLERTGSGEAAASWSSEEAERAAAAMVQLIRVERGGEAGPVEIGPLLDYATGAFEKVEDAEIERVRAQVSALQAAIGWTYADDGGNQPWPSRLRYEASGGEGSDPLVAGADALGGYWKQLGAGDRGVLGEISELQSAAADFAEAERELQGIDFAAAETVEGFEQRLARWRSAFSRLSAAREALAGAVEPLAEAIDGAGSGEGAVKGALERAANAQRDRLIEARASALLDAVGEPEGETRLARVRDALAGAREEAVAAADESLRERLSGFDAAQQALVRAMGSGSEGGERVFGRRFALYAWADGLLPREGDGEAGSEVWSVPPGMDAIARALGDVASVADPLEEAGLVSAGSDGETDGADAAPLTPAAGTARRVRDGVLRYRAHALIERVLSGITDPEVGIGGLVRREVERDSELEPLPSGFDIPLSGFVSEASGAHAGGLDDARHPDGGQRVLAAIEAIGARLEPGSGERSGIAPLDAARLRERWAEARRQRDQYVASYRRYWDGGLREAMRPRNPGSRDWAETRARLDDLEERMDEINARLVEVARLGREAMAIDAVRADGGGDDGESSWHDRIIEALEGGSGRDSYADRLGAVLSNWLYLGAGRARAGEGSSGGVPTPSAEHARAAVLEMSAQDFDANLLEGVYAERDAEVGYWSDVVFELLSSLARSSERLAGEELDQLRRLGRRFPVCLDAPVEDGLTRAQIETLYETVRSLSGAGRGGDGEASGLIGDGQSVMGRRGEVNRQLERLRGGTLIGESERRWLREHVLVVLEFLRGDGADPAWLEWELHAIPAGDSLNPGAFQVRRFRLVDGAGEVLSEGHGSRGILTSGAHEEEFGRFSAHMEPGTLAIEGATSTDPTPDQWARWVIPGRWTALGLLARDGAERLEGDAGIWRVPTGLDGASEAFRQTFAIGARFGTFVGNRFVPREVPDLRNEWPSVDDQGWR